MVPYILCHTKWGSNGSEKNSSHYFDDGEKFFFLFFMSSLTL